MSNAPAKTIGEGFAYFRWRVLRALFEPCTCSACAQTHFEFWEEDRRDF